MHMSGGGACLRAAGCSGAAPAVPASEAGACWAAVITAANSNPGFCSVCSGASWKPVDTDSRGTSGCACKDAGVDAIGGDEKGHNAAGGGKASNSPASGSEISGARVTAGKPTAPGSEYVNESGAGGGCSEGGDGDSALDTAAKDNSPGFEVTGSDAAGDCGDDATDGGAADSEGSGGASGSDAVVPAAASAVGSTSAASGARFFNTAEVAAAGAKAAQGGSAEGSEVDSERASSIPMDGNTCRYSMVGCGADLHISESEAGGTGNGVALETAGWGSDAIDNIVHGCVEAPMWHAPSSTANISTSARGHASEGLACPLLQQFSPLLLSPPEVLLSLLSPSLFVLLVLSAS
mmetsp:Transcript_49190/g.87823  ORF Transcript_49190/g.87823 Transcript_49190/m.87823 type:complete len:350 (-) Transcript_49190:1748-2797(-)